MLTNDQSMLLFVSGVYSLAQDLDIDFGLVLGSGGKGTEFGGVETAPQSEVFLKIPDQLYARLTSYFSCNLGKYSQNIVI